MLAGLAGLAGLASRPGQQGLAGLACLPAAQPDSESRARGAGTAALALQFIQSDLAQLNTKQVASQSVHALLSALCPCELLNKNKLRLYSTTASNRPDLQTGRNGRNGRFKNGCLKQPLTVDPTRANLSALCSLLSALCSLLSALCPLMSALCSALCPLPSALCPIVSAPSFLLSALFPL